MENGGGGIIGLKSSRVQEKNTEFKEVGGKRRKPKRGHSKEKGKGQRTEGWNTKKGEMQAANFTRRGLTKESGFLSSGSQPHEQDNQKKKLEKKKYGGGGGTKPRRQKIFKKNLSFCAREARKPCTILKGRKAWIREDSKERGGGEGKEEGMWWGWRTVGCLPPPS